MIEKFQKSTSNDYQQILIN